MSEEPPNPIPLAELPPIMNQKKLAEWLHRSHGLRDSKGNLVHSYEECPESVINAYFELAGNAIEECGQPQPERESVEYWKGQAERFRKAYAQLLEESGMKDKMKKCYELDEQGRRG